MSEVVFIQQIDAELAKQLTPVPSLEAALAAAPRPLHHSKPIELSVELLDTAARALRSWFPEEAALIAHLEGCGRTGPQLIDVKRARRLGALLHFADAGLLRDAIQKEDPTLSDTKQVTTFVRVLRNTFAQCGLQRWGAVVVRGQAVPKKVSRLTQLEAENARLRALLQKHGIDPGEHAE